jgi:hypothetical protein
MTTPRLKELLGTFSADADYPKAQGYNLLINDQWFRTVAGTNSPIQIGTRDSLAERSDDKGSIYENVLDIGYAWARTDLSGGEGLDWEPRQLAIERGQEALDKLRYWESCGIDVSRPFRDEKYTIRLAPLPETWYDPTSSANHLASSGELLFANNGSDVEWFEDLANTTPEGSATTTSVTSGLAASPDGTICSVGGGPIKAIRKTAGTPSFTTAYDHTIDSYDAYTIWFAGGRFIFSSYNSGLQRWALKTLEHDGSAWTSSTIDTSEDEFVSVVDSGPAIVAACLDGTVRTYTPDTGTAGLPLKVRGRTDMPNGEAPVSLGSVAGVLVIMTQARDHTSTNDYIVRLYQSEVLDQRFDYVVGQLQLLREMEASGTINTQNARMVASRDALYIVGVRTRTTLYPTIWRFDAVTSGLSKLYEGTVASQFRSPVVFDQRLLFEDTTSDTFMMLGDDYQDDGWMIFPNLTFGLNTDISWLNISVEVENLAASLGTFEVWTTTNPEAITDKDHANWSLAKKLNATSREEVTFQLSQVRSRSLALQIRMYTGLPTTTPHMARIGLRGIPSHRDVVALVPVNVSDYVSAPNRRVMHLPHLGDALHSALLDLAGEAVDATILDPPVRMRGVVNNVSEPILHQSPRGSVTRYCMVELRGEQIPEDDDSDAIFTETDGFGIGTFGVVTHGLDQNV